MYFDWFDFAHHKYTQYKQKGFVHVFFIATVLLVIILIGGGIFWAQKINKESSTDRTVLHLKQLSDTEKIVDPKSSTNPNQDETANWETYTNTKYGFLIKYPIDWSVDALKTVPDVSLEESSVPAIFGPEGCSFKTYRCGSIQFNMTDLTNTKYAAFSSKDYYEYFKSDPHRETISEEEVYIGNEKAYGQVFRVLNTANKELHRQITVVRKHVAYRLDLFEGKANDGISTDNAGINSVSDWYNNKTFNKILATFKFLDQRQAEENSPKAFELAKKDLVTTLGVKESEIILEKAAKIEWGDSSLGCPKEGQVYTQIITRGYKVIFIYNQNQYEYHTDLGSKFVSCN